MGASSREGIALEDLSHPRLLEGGAHRAAMGGVERSETVLQRNTFATGGCFDGSFFIFYLRTDIAFLSMGVGRESVSSWKNGKIWRPTFLFMDVR